jgi:hypothetical protein
MAGKHQLLVILNSCLPYLDYSKPKDIVLINTGNHTDLHKNLKTNDSFMIPV